MDNPDPRTTLTTPGHENHGSGFLCHNCGWAYPNSHPSAKHRRSHKKICGTIEGYKSTIDQEKNPNLTVSDNDEDDLKTPSPKLVKNLSSKAGSGSFGALSNRSEYDVFSDAVAEFSDSGTSPGIEDDLMVHTRESVSNAEKVADVEPSNTKLLDKEISAKDVTGSPSSSIASEEVLKEDEKYLDRKIKVPPSESLMETMEGEPKLEEMNVHNLDTQVDEPIARLKEERSDSSRHTILQSDVSPEVEPDTVANTAQIEAKSAHAFNLASEDTTERSEAMEEGNNSHHFVIFPDRITVVNHPESKVEGYKDQNAFKNIQDLTLDSLELSKGEEDGDKHLVSEANSISESTHMSKSADVSFLAAHLVEGDTIKKNTDDMLLSDKLVVPAYEIRPEIEKSETVSSPEKQVSEDVLSKMILPDHVSTVPSDTDSLFSLTEVDISQIVNLLSGDDAEDVEKAVKETCKIEDNDCKEEAKEERETNILGSENDPCAILSDLKKVDKVDDHDMVDSKISDTDIEFTHLDQVSDSSRVGIDAIHSMETHCNPTVRQDEVSQESAEEPEINYNKNVELLERSQENQTMKESVALPVEAATVENSDIVLTGVIGDCVSSIVSESMPEQQGDKSISSKQQHGCVSADSLSQTDSLEGNWGSVSDAAGKDNSREGHHHSDKLDISEPPSFMTLVERPRVHADDSKNTLEIQNSQQSNAGWFPSITDVVNDSQGRKKNEEIIAKVKNWTAETQQHTPLKSLLGDANAETKQKDSNVSVVTTVNSILGSDPPVDKDSKVGTEQEWNSPAKYSAEIKREKRKVKGKPYWAPFICCSSAVK